jgi:hypothetical protein
MVWGLDRKNVEIVVSGGRKRERAEELSSARLVWMFELAVSSTAAV